MVSKYCCEQRWQEPENVNKTLTNYDLTVNWGGSTTMCFCKNDVYVVSGHTKAHTLLNWFLVACSIRKANSLINWRQSWFFSGDPEIMVSHTGSAIRGMVYRLQMVVLHTNSNVIVSYNTVHRAQSADRNTGQRPLIAFSICVLNGIKMNDSV